MEVLCSVQIFGADKPVGAALRCRRLSLLTKKVGRVANEAKGCRFITRSCVAAQSKRMICSTASTNTLTPSDLDVLQRVLANVCSRRNLEKSGPDAENIAAELVDLYRMGVRREQELSALIS